MSQSTSWREDHGGGFFGSQKIKFFPYHQLTSVPIIAHTKELEIELIYAISAVLGLSDLTRNSAIEYVKTGEAIVLWKNNDTGTSGYFVMSNSMFWAVGAKKTLEETAPHVGTLEA